MIHRCESCPGVNAVKKFIPGELKKADGDGQVDDYDDVEITFQQWTTSYLLSTFTCFISDDLKHDVNFVCKVIEDTIKYIRDNITEALSKVDYFPDGCAGQYKSCKNCLVLCLHNSDFGVKCEWNFFATRHGKSPGDSIGGKVKQLVTRASLQRPISNQILTADKMFEFFVEENKKN